MWRGGEGYIVFMSEDKLPTRPPQTSKPFRALRAAVAGTIRYLHIHNSGMLSCEQCFSHYFLGVKIKTNYIVI